jgi:hypothetical protein
MSAGGMKRKIDDNDTFSKGSAMKTIDNDEQ